MTKAPDFTYPDPPIAGGYTTRPEHHSSSGPQSFADFALDLTNPAKVRMTKRAGRSEAPQARRAYRAEPGVLDQLVHVLAQLHGEERTDGKD